MNLRIEREIDAPADAVWKLLGHEFADIAEWSTTVEKSRAITTDEITSGLTPAADAPVPGRETVTKAATLREIITDYSDADRELTFAGEGLPKVFTLATDRQRVEALGDDRSKVTFDVHMEAKFPVSLMLPLIKRRMAKTFGLVQEELGAAAR